MGEGILHTQAKVFDAGEDNKIVFFAMEVGNHYDINWSCDTRHCERKSCR